MGVFDLGDSHTKFNLFTKLDNTWQPKTNCTKNVHNLYFDKQRYTKCRPPAYQPK